MTRVMVIDDDPVICAMLEAALIAEGHEVMTRTHAVDIVVGVLDWEPEVLIMDILMQPVNGLTALEALRAAGLVPALPVILLSAYDADPQLLRLLGARTRVAKPPDLDVLLTLIANPPPEIEIP